MSVETALQECLISPNVSDRNGEAANMVDVLDVGASALHRLATALERLGLNNATTDMGGIELLAKEVRDGSALIAGALVALANAVENHDK